MSGGDADFEGIKKRYEPWILENHRLAEYWMPRPVDWAIVAESPPCPKNEQQWLCPRYVYRVRDRGRGGHLLGAVVGGICGEDVYEWKHKKRLRKLNEARACILDVCELPVDHLPRNFRIRAIAASLGTGFGDRLAVLNPDNIIVLGGRNPGEFGNVVMNGLDSDYRRKVRNENAIPFPHGGGNNFANCREGIRQCVERSGFQGHEEF